jgi:Kdo2-lipid IVA lauroyltransferase/acyltransferase
VQFKMAGTSRILQQFYRLYFGLWIPSLAWASTRLPLSLMYWVARWFVIRPFMAVRPKYGVAVRRNYARILSLPPRHPEVRRAARQMMFEHAYHWIDFFRYSQLPPQRLDEMVAAVEGQEHFDLVRSSGRGTLLLTAHMGNPEVAAVGIGHRAGALHVLYWRDRFATAEEFRARMRLRGNVHGIPVDSSPLSVVPALRVLREGRLLAAHGDRDLNDFGWPAMFFGQLAKFPPGPFLLAARAEALILPCFFLSTPERRFRVIYDAPIDLCGEGALEDRVRDGLTAWVALLQRRILETPSQWYCFYPFWGDSERD